MSYPGLFIAILLLGFGAVVCLVSAGQLIAWQRMGHWTRLSQASSQHALNELFIAKITPRDVTLLSLAAIIAIAAVIWLLTDNPIVTLAAAVAGFFAPNLVFSHLRRRRRQRFDEQLPIALDQLASSTRAGLNLIKALEDASRTAPVPVCQELGLIVRDYQMGQPINLAIDGARRRIKSPAFDLVASALIVNRARGGSLPEALTTMASSLREIWRLEQKLLTATAEGRKAIKTISLLPVGILLLVLNTQPDIIALLTSTVAGLMFVTVAALLYAIALLWLRRVLTVDI